MGKYLKEQYFYWNGEKRLIVNKKTTCLRMAFDYGDLG
jgi:hypothetical protein